MIKFLLGFLVFVTYIYSLGEVNSLGTYINYFTTFCINTLILLDFILIRNYDKRKRKRRIEKYIDIKEIDKLDENCIIDSIEIIHRKKEADLLKYDLQINRKRRLRCLGLFNIVVIVLGSIPVALSAPGYQDIMTFILQIMVGLANVIFLYLEEYEQGEVRIYAKKLTQYSKQKNEADINDFYAKNMTLIMHKEEIMYVENQPYYVVIYSNIHRVSRLVFDLVVALVFISCVVMTQINGGIIGNMFSESNIFLNNYPSLILLAFCHSSNISFHNRINEHIIRIEDGTKENLQQCESNEQKRLYYECTDKKQTKSFILVVMEVSKFESVCKKIRQMFKVR